MRQRTNKAAGSLLTEDDGQLFSSRLEAAIDNDPDAIRELVDEFGPGLTNYARRQGIADPEGMANTALFGAIQNLDTFRGRDRGTFRGYLYRILRRRVVDEVRYASSRPRTVADSAAEAIGGPVDERASSFDEQIVNEDYVDALLTTLTREQRQILEMRLLDDLSIQETADRTGRSVPAVKAMQRRAIVSLRVVVAGMAILAAVFGLRILLADGGGEVVVENGPAGGGAVVDDGGGDPIDDGTTGADDESGAPAVLPEPDTETEAEAEAEDAATLLTGEDGVGDPVVIAGASSVAVEEAPTTTAPPEPATETTAAPEQPAEPAPAVPAAPCSVVTDGSPTIGEIAFVTYNFSGPYALFRGTESYMPGPSGGSAILTGFGQTERVWNGRTLPFEVRANMFNDNGRFLPETALAGGVITARCEIVAESPPTPCQVTTDGSPKVGEEATVTYEMTGVYDALNGRWTSVAGRNGESAFPPGRKTQEVNLGTTLTFVLNQSMWTNGELDVRSQFRTDEGFIRCSVD